MYMGKLSQLLVSATLSVSSLTGFQIALGGELSSKAASELMAARQEYINAYQSLTNKSQQIEQFNKSAPNAILNLTSSAESLQKELSNQCQLDCMAIAESHDKMMTAKYEESISSLQRRIEEISNRFFGDAAREARWHQATQEVSHHFPNIQQEVAEIIQRKYAADYERAIAEARSAIQEEFSGLLSEHQAALIADYDRRFSQVLVELDARLTQEINQLQNTNNSEIDNIQRSCNAEQQACENRWQSAHRQRLDEIESWFKRRWNEIVNDPQSQMWGAWGQQAIQHQTQEAQIAAANAQRQSYENCQMQCNNELELIFSRHQRAANEANNRAQQRLSQLNSHYESMAQGRKAELSQSIQQELDAYAETLKEQFSERGLDSPEIQKLEDIMSQEAEQQINERCELLIRRCFLDKEAQASDLCQSLIAAENQNAKIEWEQIEEEAEQICLAQIESIQESYKKRLNDAQTRLYGAAGKIFEEYNQAQIAVNEAKRKFEEKGLKLVEAQSQEPNFMDELDEMEDSERTPSLFQALKDAVVNGFKNAIPIWTPTKDAMTAMDAIAHAAMEGRYEDIDENFNKVSQELVNLMRDTNDARYGFIIKPMIWEQITNQVEKYKKETGSYTRNYKWSNEFISSERILKDKLPNAKTQDQIKRVHRDAQIAKKYEMSHKRQMWWKETGFPDFEPYAKTSSDGRMIKVEIEVSGNRSTDNARAAKKALELGMIENNNLADFVKPDSIDFVWHHMEDGKTMLLVPKDLHEAFPHTGGVSIKKQAINKKIIQ